MKKRIFESWRTSLIGVALLGVAIAGAWFGKWTFAEATAFIPFIAGAFLMKDKKTP